MNYIAADDGNYTDKYQLDLKNDNVIKLLSYLTHSIPVKQANNEFKLYSKEDSKKAVQDLLSMGKYDEVKDLLRILEKKELKTESIIKYVPKSVRVSPAVYFYLSSKAQKNKMPVSHVVGNIAVKEFYNFFNYIISSYSVDQDREKKINELITRWANNINRRDNTGKAVSIGERAYLMFQNKDWEWHPSKNLSEEEIDEIKKDDLNNWELYDEYDTRGYIPDWDYHFQNGPYTRIFPIEVEEKNYIENSNLFLWAVEKKFEQDFPNKEESSRVFRVLKENILNCESPGEALWGAVFIGGIQTDGIELHIGQDFPAHRISNEFWESIHEYKNDINKITPPLFREESKNAGKLLINETYPGVLEDLQKSLKLLFEDQGAQGYYINIKINTKIESDLNSLYINDIELNIFNSKKIYEFILKCLVDEISKQVDIPSYDDNIYKHYFNTKKIIEEAVNSDIERAKRYNQYLIDATNINLLTSLVINGICAIKSEVITITMPRCLTNIWDSARGKRTANDFIKYMILKYDKALVNKEGGNGN